MSCVQTRKIMPWLASVGISYSLLALTTGCGGGGGGGTTDATPQPTPSPSTSPVTTPTPTPVPTATPVVTPTPVANSYQVTFGAPPTGYAAGSQLPTAAQDVTITGNVNRFEGGKATSLTLNAQHGGASGAANTFTFTLSDLNGLSAGQVREVGAYQVNYNELSDNRVTRQANSLGRVNLQGNGTITIVSLSGGTAHLIGTNILMQNDSYDGNGYSYFTVSFDITVTLPVKNTI